MTEDEKYMGRALKEADKAAARGEVPVGCVIVIGDKVVARGHNLKETRNDPTAHAEIVALRKAGKKTGQLAAGKGHGLCYLRAVRDVRGRAGLGAGEAGGVWLPGPQGRGH